MDDFFEVAIPFRERGSTVGECATQARDLRGRADAVTDHNLRGRASDAHGGVVVSDCESFELRSSTTSRLYLPQYEE